MKQLNLVRRREPVMKKCKRCLIEKSEDEFYSIGRIKGVYGNKTNSLCKICYKDKMYTTICKYCNCYFPCNHADFCSLKCRILDRRKIVENNCWTALFNKTRKQSICIQDRHKTRTLLLRNIAFELYVHKIPEGMRVVNTCNNKYCFNPEHLGLESKRNRQISFSIEVTLYNKIEKLVHRQ